MDTWYIVSKERHEGLSWWHRQVHGLSEPQGIQGQPGQFIETLSHSKKKVSKITITQSEKESLPSYCQDSMLVLQCEPQHTQINMPLSLKWGGCSSIYLASSMPCWLPSPTPFISSIVVLGVEPRACVSQASTLLLGTADHQMLNLL